MSSREQWYRLADMPVSEVCGPEPESFATGRQMRAFQRLASTTFYRHARETPVPTMGAVFDRSREADAYTKLDIGLPTTGDLTLHFALQDLGDDINVDIHDAAEAAFASAPFAGVDAGIEPVADDLIRRAIPAMQRELDRELRTGPTGKRLPAVPLGKMPWAVQRALIERRRLRYQQFGITRQVWETKQWSLWDVPRDDDYIPLRAAREHAGAIEPSAAMDDNYAYLI